MSNGTTESLLGIIPVAIAGGLVIKMTDWAFSQQPKVVRGRLVPRVKRRPKKRPRELYFGDFRNLGYEP